YEQFFRHEMTIINTTLQHLGVKAAAVKGRSFIAGNAFIAYGIIRAPGVKLSDVRKLTEDVEVAIADFRKNEELTVRFNEKPTYFEVPHPHPAPKFWDYRNPALQHQHTMLLGRKYGYGQRRGLNSFLSLSNAAHTLVAGTTGSGKTTIMRIATLSLMLMTPPEELMVVGIDLKNEDFVLYEQLPHVKQFAYTLEDAITAVEYVYRIKNERQTHRTANKPRLLFIVDEYAEFQGNKDIIAMISSVAGIGRSKNINALIATQLPTAKVLGSLVKANLPSRLVGRVASATDANTASGMAGTGAHSLVGKGAFLRIENGVLSRIQSYFIDDDGVADVVNIIQHKWRHHQWHQAIVRPIHLAQMEGIDISKSELIGNLNEHGGFVGGSENHFSGSTGGSDNQFGGSSHHSSGSGNGSGTAGTSSGTSSDGSSNPRKGIPSGTVLDAKRIPESFDERVYISRIYAENDSLSATCREVYGSKNDRSFANVKYAVGKMSIEECQAVHRGQKLNETDKVLQMVSAA
ncbi:MAG: FtsK/SpoIIIE domain-containing protein, partial [Chloroflexota bacterium]